MGWGRKKDLYTTKEIRSCKLKGCMIGGKNNNNNEVLERRFSTEPKVRTANNQTKRSDVPDTKISHAAHTNVSLTSLSLHLHTHTRARACMYARTKNARAHTYCPNLLEAGRKQLKSIGVEDRKGENDELCSPPPPPLHL